MNLRRVEDKRGVRGEKSCNFNTHAWNSQKINQKGKQQASRWKVYSAVGPRCQEDVPVFWRFGGARRGVPHALEVLVREDELMGWGLRVPEWQWVVPIHWKGPWWIASQSTSRSHGVGRQKAEGREEGWGLIVKTGRLESRLEQVKRRC